MDDNKFGGFELPKSNYSKLPHQMIDALPLIETVSEMKVILYVLRHTWGFQEFDELKRITLDEFRNGRKRKNGSRMDEGTGLSTNAIKDGIARAVKHGFLIQISDGRDFGRSSHTYQLRVSNSDTVSNSDNQPSKVDSQSSDFDSRSEKDTFETNSKKEKKPPDFPEKKERTDEQETEIGNPIGHNSGPDGRDSRDSDLGICDGGLAETIDDASTFPDGRGDDVDTDMVDPLLMPLDRATLAKREELGGNLAVPPPAGGSDVAADAGLTALHEAKGGSAPRKGSGTYVKELEAIGQALRDRGETDPEVARLAAQIFVDEKPKLACPHYKSFVGDYGEYLGRARQRLDKRRKRAEPPPDYEPEGDYEPVYGSDPEPPPEPLSEIERVWRAALGELELQMTRATFDTWVRHTRAVSREDGIFVIGVQNEVMRDWLESRLKTTAQRTLVGILDEQVEVEFEVK